MEKEMLRTLFLSLILENKMFTMKHGKRNNHNHEYIFSPRKAINYIEIDASTNFTPFVLLGLVILFDIYRTNFL